MHRCPYFEPFSPYTTYYEEAYLGLKERNNGEPSCEGTWCLFACDAINKAESVMYGIGRMYSDMSLHKEDCVDATVVFRVVHDLCVLSPDDAPSLSDETEICDVDFDDGTLGDDAEAGVHG